MKHTISVIYGSVRADRVGIKAAQYLEKQLLARNHKVHFIDPMVYQLPLLDKMYRQYEKGQAPENLQKLADLFTASDGFLIVSGEYNHSVPPALKNLLDHFQREYYFKASAIATYSAGIFAGVRAALHLRTILGELGMPAISSMQPFPQVHKAFNDKLQAVQEITDKSTSKFLDEFEWYMQALKVQREKGLPW